jgi:hypothetical protein
MDGAGEVEFEPGANHTYTTTEQGYSGRCFGAF